MDQVKNCLSQEGNSYVSEKDGMQISDKSPYKSDVITFMNQ